MSLQTDQLAPFPQAHAGFFAPPVAAAPLRQALEAAPVAKLDNRLEVPLQELGFRHLRSAAEISQIVHLRQEIQLPASALADPAFHTREKKETNSGL